MSKKMSVYFKINEDSVYIDLDYEASNQEEYDRILNDDYFAVNKIFSLVISGQINCKGNIIEILRGNDLDMLHKNPDRIFVDTDTTDSKNQNPNLKISAISQKSSCSGSGENKDWQDDETKYLLDQVYAYLPVIGPQKKFKTKKAMWLKIAEEISQKFCKIRTSVQVENRYKTILRRKKSAVENNSQSGSSRQDVPFEEEMHKIASTDDSIEPNVVRTATGMKRYKNSEGVSVKISKSSSPGNRKKTKNWKNCMRRQK
ncbi:PREDICTED: uncharacterized protein LOC105458971 isoform X2 [Wasmannia auropunctata]|uniref:uncharacterized protein LOC105458971 isoform X2 n=1 Tax=Wasmannia auropunctata TaxID=64793 RepID=UPI0005EE1ACD|nr:PREDICTED: uncharacterized protein LOC105458971 isoform X2 [Wasmannia auropunctata]